MKSNGIIRRFDELGRIVIPIEIRQNLNLQEKDSIEIMVSGTTIYLKKVENTCTFCRSNKDLTFFKEKYICKNCIKNMKK